MGKLHGNDKHDWQLIKRDYVEGVQQEDGTITWPTLLQVSKDHNISRSTLSQRAAAEDWQTQKSMFRTKIETKRQDKKTEYLASEAAQFDIDVFKIAKASIQHIQSHFLLGQAELLRTEGRKPMASTTINSLTIALERVQRIGRLALGEPLEIQGTGADGDKYFLIQEIIKDAECADKIKRNFRSRAGGSFSAE